MGLNEEFLAMAEKSKTLPEKPGNDVLLKMYGLFKQATSGDNNTPKPTGFDFKGAAKHTAWLQESGKSKEEAMTEYLEFVGALFD
ncbi:MAG: acyl-CoA-binding protein [bacterium]|nr:acyl-CoA-binding protein [bacterium]